MEAEVNDQNIKASVIFFLFRVIMLNQGGRETDAGNVIRVSCVFKCTVSTECFPVGFKRLKPVWSKHWSSSGFAASSSPESWFAAPPPPPYDNKCYILIRRLILNHSHNSDGHALVFAHKINK